MPRSKAGSHGETSFLGRHRQSGSYSWQLAETTPQSSLNYLGCLTVTLTGSETLLRLNSYSRGFRWNESLSFWVIKVFESQKDTTPPGQILGNAKSKQT